MNTYDIETAPPDQIKTETLHTFGTDDVLDLLILSDSPRLRLTLSTDDTLWVPKTQDRTVTLTAEQLDGPGLWTVSSHSIPDAARRIALLSLIKD